MKILKFIIIITALFCTKLNAQEVKKTFVPYYIENDTINTFERIGAKEETKIIGFGYGGVNNYLTIFKKPNSPLRFNSTQRPKFIIKVDEGTDILELVILVKADVFKRKKNYRRFVLEGKSLAGVKDMSKHFILPELKEISDNLYEMVFSQELEAGEYAFQPIYRGEESKNIKSTSGKVRVYCFGIDN